MSYVGIDLGTTNSVICSYDGTTIKVYKSPEQHSVTPSAIYIDRRTRYYGARAYDAAARYPNNVAQGFKRLMGSGTPIAIPAAKLVMSPEECSAEILRHLYSYLPEIIRTASNTGTVITVPAAFDQMQRDATLSAADLAGIGRVALMQEPVAAVMSVMEHGRRDGFFVIYDLGGGTFDVAIAESVRGRVSVLDHGGISFCGGRDFDRLLMDNVVVPWLGKHFKLANEFPTGNKYSRFRKLAVWAAEKAKIQLSYAQSALISLSEEETQVDDEDGRPIYLDVEVTRETLEDLIRERLDETVQETRESMKRAGLSSRDVDVIIFIGGPTQFDPLRDYISAQLGLKSEMKVDPMTAVAEGAAIFAESVDWSGANLSPKAVSGAISVSSKLGFSCEFAARTVDTKTEIVVRCDDSQLHDECFQIENLDSGWSSGRTKLLNGVACEVQLPGMGANNFRVSLFTANSVPVDSAGSRLTITRTAAMIDAIPASHSIGVEVRASLHGNSTAIEYLVRKGDALPKKGKRCFKAAERLAAGSQGSLIFKLFEGEIENPVTNNRAVGCLKIRGTDFESGVIRPGDELECEYEVGESGRLSLRVDVPSIESSFGEQDLYSRQEGQLDFTQSEMAIKASALETRVQIEQIELRVKAPDFDDARRHLDKAQTACSDPAADPELMKGALEEVEKARAIVAGVRQKHLKIARQGELDEVVAAFHNLVKGHAKPSEESAFDAKARTAERMMANSSGEFDSILDEMRDSIFNILWRQDDFVVATFIRFTEQPYLFRDLRLYQELADEGNQAVEKNAFGDLRRVVGKMYSIKAQNSWADDLRVVNITR